MKAKFLKIFIIISLLINYTLPLSVFAEELIEENPVTIVATGDIEGEVEVENISNNNDTSFLSDESSSDSQDSVAGNENEVDFENNISGDFDSGENAIENEDGDSIIVSGDIDIQTQTVNQGNTNFTDASCGDECATDEEVIDEGSSDEEALQVETVEGEEIVDDSPDSTELLLDDDGEISELDSASTTVQNTNQATTTNNAGIDASTGDNIVSGGQEALIETGSIGIINIIVNYINTNFFGSGKEFFVNIFNKIAGSIDLSSFGIGQPSDTGECQTENCQLNIENKNESQLENNIVIDAKTGANVIMDAGGQASIETGDISVINDVLNIANLNVSGDDWFFAVVNIFGELQGDIILPPYLPGEAVEELTTEQVLAEAVESATESDKEYIVANENMADLINNISINPNTGDNEIASSVESYIETGQIEIKMNMFNLINYNITGNAWKFARVNVFGNWQGIIEGLPDTYNYLEDESGITIYNSFLDDFTISEDDYIRFLVSNENQATTTNNIEINANTGDNSILRSLDYASISTGDISIVNNLLNFINSNFTGNNWEFSMVNVFGDWQGNLSFGQPDLWIVESHDASSLVGPSDYVTYTFLFGNNGDATARNVLIKDYIDPSLINVVGAEAGNLNDSVVLWSLGDLPPNTQGSISYAVQVKSDIPYGGSQIVNQVHISGNENERDYANNSSSGLVNAYRAGGAGSGSGSGSASSLSSGSGGSSSLHPNFSIIKTNNAEGEVRPGDIVDYRIVIKNSGLADALDVLVLDVLRNQDTDQEINRKVWDLETVQKGEEVIIEYSLEIKNDIVSGTYNNEVMVEGWDSSAVKYITAVASSKIKVDNSVLDEPIVLGVEGKSDLVIRKTWPTEVMQPGDVFDYTITVENFGEIDALNVRLSEYLPNELAFLDDDEHERHFELGDLVPFEETVISLTAYVVDGADSGEYSSETILKSANGEDVKIISLITIDQFLAETNNTEESDEPLVLAATGFSFYDLAILLGLMNLVFWASRLLKKLKRRTVFDMAST